MRPTRGKSAQRGQSAVEFALTLPILALILIGSISIGRAAYDASIVQELSVEAGKMGGIDRLDPGGSQAYQLSDNELVDWIRESAHVVDPTISKTSIGCDPNFYPVSGDPSQLNGGKGKNGNDIYNGLTGFLSTGNSGVAQALNPSLETVHLRYNYSTGIAGGLAFPINYQFNFTKFQMVWLPIVAALTKASTASSSCTAAGS